MASLQLSERVIDAAIAKLRGGMAARVAAINAEFNDAVTITPPLEQDFYPFGVAPLPRSPAVVVTDGGSPEGPGFTEEGPHSFEYTAMLLVVVYDEDSDRERLGRKLLRQTRAAIETLWDDAPAERLEIVVNGVLNQPYIRPDRELPGRVFQPDDESSFWRATRVAVFTVTKSEN